MKLIIISDIEMFADEASIVSQLFDNGLQLFHLRKYDNSKTEIITFINSIKPEYRNRIVLHQFHEIAGEFGITRLHFSERDRKAMNETELMSLRNENKVLSTSVHSLEEYNALSSCFDYAFLSPVFDSISKRDYKSVSFDLTEKTGSAVKLIALGGVTQDNCLEAIEMGFDGLALLGTIWKSENKIESFKKIKNKVPQITQTVTDEIYLR